MGLNGRWPTQARPARYLRYNYMFPGHITGIDFLKMSQSIKIGKKAFSAQTHPHGCGASALFLRIKSNRLSGGIMATSEYQKRQDGDKVIFDVTPASCPRNKSVLYIAVPIFFIIGISLLMSGMTGILILIFVGGPIAYIAFYKDWRPAEHRAPSTFSVSPTEIEWKGRTFKKEDIHRLIIKNGMTKSEVAHAFVASGRASGSFAVGMQYREKIAAVANALNLETGGNAYPLAGGMSETTAFGLMTDVNRALGVQGA